MKKILLILLLSVFFIQGVNAETLYCDYSNKYPEYFEKYGKDFVIGELNSLLNLYNTKYSNDYPFYQIDAEIYSNNTRWLVFSLVVFTANPQTEWEFISISDAPDLARYFPHYNLNLHITELITYEINEQDNSLTLVEENFSISTSSYLNYRVQDGVYYDCFITSPFYTSLNPVFTMPDDNNITQINLQTVPGSNNYEVLNSNTIDYTFKSYSSYIGLDPFYTEVNLDNYEYVILSLKDYTSNDSFDTNLKVKGMVGITPVYEFGTVEKENLTDRCNISYSEYTDYRFFILKNDLLNNAVYYVKSCEENSSFKFNSLLFNITYITADNANAPSIAVGNNTYNIIPFNKLTTTANSNESNNFIPGESGSSLSDAINNTGKYIYSFWNSLVTIMGFATKFFNTLPIEIRSISITAFCTAITLGIIKFIKS